MHAIKISHYLCFQHYIQKIFALFFYFLCYNYLLILIDCQVIEEAFTRSCTTQRNLSPGRLISAQKHVYFFYIINFNYYLLPTNFNIQQILLITIHDISNAMLFHKHTILLMPQNPLPGFFRTHTIELHPELPEISIIFITEENGAAYFGQSSTCPSNLSFYGAFFC